MTLTSKKLAAAVLAITVAMSLSACSNWSKRDRNTAIGAGAGALGGAVLTDGSTLGTLGGAAVGGIIIHVADAAAPLKSLIQILLKNKYLQSSLQCGILPKSLEER